MLNILNPAVTAQAQENDSENLSVIFVIDDSGSMETNDPANIRVTAVKLFIALLDPGDGVAIISFADESQINSHFTTIQVYEDKVGLINSLGEIQSEGYTNMQAAFEDVFQVFSEDTTGNKQVVIFLTDGTPEMEGGLPPDYKEETLELIEGSGIPIMSIGLTTGGLSPFLGEITDLAADGSEIIPAKSANDLLDVYLRILGQLKDRTILGNGIVQAPGSADLTIDPMLAQYIDEVSFVAMVSSNSQETLISPSGEEILPSNEIFSETFVDIDPNFKVMTLPVPIGGNWQMEFQGSGPNLARGILRSRLRIDVLEPGYLSPVGEPMLIAANLIIEDPPLPPIVSIGDVTFTALIERPDGQRESLDLLYDDGTHGDLIAGDGDFTNVYVNTDIPGTYSINISGWKGVVPVSTNTKVELIKVPEMIVDMPLQKVHEVRGAPIKLQVHLEGDESSKLDKGDVIAKITSPTGGIIENILEPDGLFYRGDFLPEEEGDYVIEFLAKDASFRGIPYTNSAIVGITSHIISTIEILTTELKLGNISVESIQDGIELSISGKSNSSEPEFIFPNLEDFYDFTLEDSNAIQLRPNDETNFILRLIPENIPVPGNYEGELIFSSREGIDLIYPNSSIIFELFKPTLQIIPIPLDFGPLDGCINLNGTKTVTFKSSSTEEEKIKLSLENEIGIKISPEYVNLLPGSSEMDLYIDPINSFPTGDHELLLSIQSRDGLVIEPDSLIAVFFSVDPLLTRCRKPFAWGGVIFVFSLLVVVWGYRRYKFATRIPNVTGTLRIGIIGKQEDVDEFDLTDLEKPKIIIGRGIDCDISIPDPKIANHHVVLEAETEEDAVRIVLNPLEETRKGYRTIKTKLPLYHKDSFLIGDREITYLSDEGY